MNIYPKDSAGLPIDMSTGFPLLEWRKPYLPPDSQFDGETYELAKDHGRLRKQMLKVFDLMKDGRWRTLGDIREATGEPEASVSARLRDLRKEKFGSHRVERRRHALVPGLFEYRIFL